MFLKFNGFSFYCSLLCFIVYSYLLYSSIKNHLIITTISSILLSLLIIILLVIGLLGFNYNAILFSKIKSWLTLVFIFLLILIVIGLHLVSFIGGKEHMQTVTSPDKAYTIHIYSWNAGAAGTFGIVAEQEGFLFNKRLFQERRIEHAEVSWINDNTIMINGRVIDLAKGETYFR